VKLINQSWPRLPIEDYSLALRKAVQWLGERYVLAVPVKPRRTDATDHGFSSRRVRQDVTPNQRVLTRHGPIQSIASTRHQMGLISTVSSSHTATGRSGFS
jgi:hypothetical protein